MSNIFLSWSKDRSLRVAEALSELIDAFMGAGTSKRSQDLAKGASWFDSLGGELEHAGAGIVCVTPENRTSPWLLFEAGALVRCDRKVQVFPLLLDITPPHLDGPLSLVQATTLERDREKIKRETAALLDRIASEVNKDIATRQLGEIALVFDTQRPANGSGKSADQLWDEFATRILEIEPVPITALVPDFRRAFERKTFQEPFFDCADQKWLERFGAAWEAHAAMKAAQSEVEVALPSAAARAYEALQSATDGYAMAIGGLLLEQRSYPRDESGRLGDMRGELTACEQRRVAIEKAYQRLTDPIPPVFDESRLYDELGSLELRKRRLLHPWERKLDELETWQIERARMSPWHFDRIVFFLSCGHRDDGPTLEDLCDALASETSRLESQDQPDTLTVLYYGLEAAEKRIERSRKSGQLPAPVSGELLDRIEQAIDRWNASAEEPSAREVDRYDANRKVRRVVARLRA